MALDLRPERYGSKALAKGAEMTGAEILSRVKPVTPTVQTSGRNPGGMVAVNDWVSRYNRVMEGVSQYDEKRNGGFTRDASGGYMGNINALIEDYENIRGIADQYGFQDSLKYLDQLKQLQNSIGQINESFSQFNDEEEYSRYMDYWKDQEEKKNLDLDAYSREIAALEQQLEDYDPQIDWTDTNQRKQYDKGLQELEDEINRRKQYLAQAQRIQKKDDFSSVANPESAKYDAAFDTKSGYVSTEQDGKLERMLSQYSMGYDDLTYEYINNQNGIRDEIKQKASAYKKGETPFEAKGYDYMTEDEVGLYNYYYSMGGKASAEAYLDTIQDDLNQRKATGMYQPLEGKTAAEMVFGVEAGLDQFKGGIKGAVRAVRGDDSYVAPSATQYASGLVREDLADDGMKLPSWLGGSSLGQVGYDAITTTANMAPSIAVGMLSPTLGTAALGVSAGGSAYQEALNEGYSVDQARGYGILSGASEIAMEKVLGGISAYGGNALGKFFTQNMKNADTALKRIAKELGGSMLSEFSEEYLQEVLTPVFRNLTLDTDEEVKLVSAEALYAGFLGAITGGIMEGPQAIANARNATVDNSNATAELDNTTPVLTNTDTVLEKSTPGEVTEESLTTELANSEEEAIAEKSPAVDDKLSATENAPTLEALSEKYGDRAADMRKTFMEGQDIEEYDRAFQMAYDMGKAGVNESYAQRSEATAYLSETQRSIAYNMGALDAQSAAGAQAAKNAAAANGKTGWHKGIVKGQGVKITDMSKAFNDPQRKAYKYLTNIAEVTGVDIMLYKSEVDQDGKYQGAQGSFKWNEDTIYIDVNAGLTRQQKLNSPEDLAKYTMMRTYTHEFTHFVEKWNPEEYNGFRKTVFEIMEANGENVDDLIVAVQNARGGNMSYDQASREVVAEAMTDILPESSFIEQLAQKNQNVFQQLLSKLKEFLTSIKQHFASMGGATREAKALKRQMGETVSYMEEIVKKFDEVAVKAVENYQRTVAEDATVSKEEKVVAKTETTTDTTTEETVTTTEEIVTASEESVIETAEVVSEVGKVASEDASLDASQALESEQHQARKTENEPTTAREWSAFNRSFANKTSGMTAGQEKKIIIWTADHAYFVNATGYMEGDITQIIRIDGNEYILEKLIKEFENGADRSGKAADTWAEAVRRRTGRRSGDHAAAEHRADAGRNDAVDDGEPRGNDQRPYWESDGYSSYEELIEAVESGALVPDENGDLIELHQERTEVLTDRDALDYAAQTGNELELTGGEQLALKAFRERLSGLQRLQEQRSDLGKEWRSQAFGEDRKPAEARKTLDKMRELDKEIKGATEKLLNLEDAPGLRAVIEKSKAAIERQENARVRAELKQYRNKQNNAVLRRRIGRHVGELSKKLLKPSDKSHVPEGLRSTVATLLNAINLESQYSLDMETGKRSKNPKGEALPVARTKAFRELREQYQSIIKDGSASSMVIDPELDSKLEELGKLENVLLEEMDAKQLKMVWEAIKAVEQSVFTAGKVLSKSKWERIDQYANDLEKTAKRRKMGWQSKRNQIILRMETPITFFAHFGKAGEYMYRMLRDAQDQEQRMRTQMAAEVQKLVTPQTVKELEQTVHKFSIGDGDTLYLSTAQVMEVYVLAKQEHARNHLVGENGGHGIVQPEIKGTYTNAENKTEKVKVSEGNQPITLSAVELGKIIGSLTEDQRKLADSLQRLTDVLAAMGNEASMQVYGYQKFTGKDYWPIRASKLQIQENTDKQIQRKRSVKNMSSAQNRQEGANNALMISGIFDTFSGHCKEMTEYAAYLAVMEDMDRLYNYKYRENTTVNGKEVWKTKAVFKGYLDQLAGKGAESYWMKLMEDIQNGIGGNDVMGSGLISKAKGAAVSGNTRVVLQQWTAYPRAIACMKASDLLFGMTHSKGAWNRALQHSPTAMRKQEGGFEIGNTRQMKEVLFDIHSGMDKMNNFLSSGAAAMDAVTWGWLWRAAEHQVARTHKHLKIGTDGYWQEVNRVFTQTIDETQVVDGILQRSQYMRNPDALSKSQTSFMGEPTMALNLLLRSYDNWAYETDGEKRKAASKKLGMATAGVVMSNSLAAVMQSVVDAWRDDDEDKTYWERFWKAFTGYDPEAETTQEAVKGVLLEGNWAGSLNPLGWIPLVKDVLSMLQGYDVIRADADVLKGLMQAAQTTTDAITGDSSKTRLYAIKELGNQASKVFAGSGAGNVLRDVYGITHSVLVEAQNAAGLYTVNALVYEPTSDKNERRYMDLLYRAIGWGDNGGYDYVRQQLMEEGYLDSDIREAMKDRIKDDYEEGNIDRETAYDRLVKYTIDPEDDAKEAENDIWFQLEAIDGKVAYKAENGDTEGYNYSRYENVYAAVRGAGNFQEAVKELTDHGYEKETVIGEVKSKIGQWQRDGEITETEARRMLTTYGGMEAEEAKARTKAWTWMKQNPKSEATVEQVEAYRRPLEGLNRSIEDMEIGMETYLKEKKVINAFESDKDENGKSIAYSRINKAFPYINRLNLTRDQKTALAVACGWSYKTVMENKLW